VARMNAAVVTSFAEPPHYQPFEVPQPNTADEFIVDVLAAAMNTAMSSWVALRRRVPIQPGQSVLVLGATGNAGAMAVRVARRLGAGRVVGAGRDPGRLAALTSAGADAVVQLAGPAMELPSAALRSANFRLQGSGQGSVSPRAYLAELPPLVAEITAGTIAVTATTRPLADVEQIWPKPEAPGERTVLVP
jgi:D-arabinose 1-dehydrogenase-like Zn-dependent alcohol dehydrogenase